MDTLEIKDKKGFGALSDIGIQFVIEYMEATND